jgi:hypothetical protein
MVPVMLPASTPPSLKDLPQEHAGDRNRHQLYFFNGMPRIRVPNPVRPGEFAV